MNRCSGKRRDSEAMASQTCSNPSPKFSRRCPVMRTKGTRAQSAPSSRSRSASMLAATLASPCRATSISRASMTVFPVTEMVSSATPSRKRAARADSVGAKCSETNGASLIASGLVPMKTRTFRRCVMGAPRTSSVGPRYRRPSAQPPAGDLPASEPEEFAVGREIPFPQLAGLHREAPGPLHADGLDPGGARRVTPFPILHGGRTRTKPFLEVASALRLHVVPPVLAPAVLVVPPGAGLLLAVAHGLDARAVHPEVHQVLLRR